MMKKKLVKFDWCSSCSRLYEENETYCPHCHRNRYFIDNKGRKQMKEYGLRVPLKDTIKDVFSTNNIKELLQYSTTRPTSNKITDVFDGNVLKQINEKTNNILQVRTLLHDYSPCLS